jgi:ADP-ribose pyrophosphatase
VDRRWQHRQANLVFENSRIRVLEDDVVQPDGTSSSYTVIEERCGAVVVVALDDDGRVALVRQHRYPIDATTLELPAGEVRPGVDPIEQAQRELAEETGIHAGRLRIIGHFTPWPARVRRRCDVVFADQLSWSRLGTDNQEGVEAIDHVGMYTPDAIRDAIATGKIFDGPTLSALTIFWAQGDPSVGEPWEP